MSDCPLGCKHHPAWLNDPTAPTPQTTRRRQPGRRRLIGFRDSIVGCPNYDENVDSHENAADGNGLVAPFAGEPTTADWHVSHYRCPVDGEEWMMGYSVSYVRRMGYERGLAVYA